MKQYILQIFGIFTVLALPVYAIWQLVGWLKEVRIVVKKMPALDALQHQVIETSVKVREQKSEIDRLDRSIVQITNYLRQQKK